MSKNRAATCSASPRPVNTRARPHGCDEAEVTKNKLSMGLDFKKARGVELLMALWRISDVWMESSAPGTLERNGITNELALAVNPRLVIVRVSTYSSGWSPARRLVKPSRPLVFRKFPCRQAE